MVVRSIGCFDNKTTAAKASTKPSLTNFMCQCPFDSVNYEFSANLSKNFNLHGQKKIGT